MSGPCLAEGVEVIAPTRLGAGGAIEICVRLRADGVSDISSPPRIVVSAFGAAPSSLERVAMRCAGGYVAHIALSADPIWTLRSIYLFVRVYVGERLVAYQRREIKTASRGRWLRCEFERALRHLPETYIIYAHADWPQVGPRVEGILVGARKTLECYFIDGLTIPNGLPWRLAEAVCLERVKDVVIFWSAATAKSREALAEIDLAYHLFHKRGGRRPRLSIIPLDDAPPPPEWKDLQFLHPARLLRSLNRPQPQLREVA